MTFKNNTLLFSITAAVMILYTISAFSGVTFIANILSPVLTFSACYMVYSSLKQNYETKPGWILLLIGLVFWASSDVLWFIYESLLNIDPEESTLLAYTYLVPNIFFMFATMYYFYITARKHHHFQVVINITFVVIYISILLWAILLKSVTLSDWSFHENATNIICILTDSTIVSLLVTLFISKENSKHSISEYLAMVSLIGYAGIDLIYVYAYWTNAYAPNKLIDYIYLIFLMLIGISSRLNNQSSQPSEENFDESAKLAFLSKPAKLLYYFLLPLIMAFIGVISWGILTLILALFILYQYIYVQLHLLIHKEELLNKEYIYSYNLENLVKERTSELELANAQLYNASISDTLVSLYNRRFIIEKMDSMIEDNTPFTIFYLDLDNYKIINDVHGHDMGDEILHKIAERIKSIQKPHQIQARLVGDEFAILDMSNDQSEAHLETVAKEIISIFNDPIIINHYRFNIVLSIGIVKYPQDGRNRITLMKNADMAMNEAKKDINICSYSFYAHLDVSYHLRRTQIELLLNQIDFDEEFFLVFQPQFNLHTKELIGVEALIRWVNPSLGNIPPNEFIKIAEENNHIINVGKWVIKRAFAQIKSWNETYGLNLKMGINVSALQFSAVDFYDFVNDHVQCSQINPRWIDFEITETSTLNTNFSLEALFNTLSSRGFQISLDDFGTGYSSLFYIKRLDIHQLKIAKELVDQIVESEQQRLIIRTIILMAKGLNIHTLAEGVETNDQAIVLEKLGCDYVQGYFFSRPISAQDFEEKYLMNKEVLVPEISYGAEWHI